MPKLFLLDDRPNTRIVFTPPARPQVARFLVPLALMVAIGVAAYFAYRPAETSAAKQTPAGLAKAAPLPAARGVHGFPQVPIAAARDVGSAGVPKGDDAPDSQRVRADRFYEDARVARLCAAWTAEQAQLAEKREKRQGRPPTAAESDAELLSQTQGEETGANTTCPALGPPDLAQAELQMKEAARLGSPEAQYEVLADRLQQIRAEKLASPASPFEAPALPSQDILNLRSDLSELANSGNVPAQFLMASTLRQGTLGETDPQLATAWEMVAVHAPGAAFDAQSLAQYGPYASASASEQAALAAAAAAIFRKVRH